MTHKAIWAGIGALIVVLGAAILLFYPHATAPRTLACTMEAKMCPDGSSVGRMGPQCEFAACPTPAFVWSFAPKGTDEATGVPHSEVRLSMNGKSYPAGVYEGNCTDIKASSWQLMAGEEAGAICWWAGGGVELGVFEEQGSFVIKKGLLDEGSDETPGLRGNFETLLRLDI